MVQFSEMVSAGAIGLLVILLGMIKIPQIEINFWGWLGRTIGRAINGEVLDKVNNLAREVETMKKEEELERVRQARQRILRFSDEVLYRKKHSKEHFDEILEDIDLYEHYCSTHEEYKNNRAVLAIATIREIYKECLQSHNFLTHSKED